MTTMTVLYLTVAFPLAPPGVKLNSFLGLGKGFGSDRGDETRDI